MPRSVYSGLLSRRAPKGCLSGPRSWSDRNAEIHRHSALRFCCFIDQVRTQSWNPAIHWSEV